MTGRAFGHHLGLPRALTGLPLAPLVPGYAGLFSAMRAQGLRHVGEGLLVPGESLRVLDGLYVVAGSGPAHRVDEHFLSGRDGTVASLLRALHARDPQAPRRVVLYQLIELLHAHPNGDDPATARELGVHPTEADGVAAAARLRRRHTERQRAAAESLTAAWESRRLRQAHRLLDRLAPDGSDPLLAGHAARLADALRTADERLGAAGRAVAAGDADAAGDVYLSVLRSVADDRSALFGLVRIHRPEQRALQIQLGLEQVQLSWPADGDVPRWQVLRLHRDGPAPGTVHRIGAATTTTAVDTAPPLGATVRYLVLPLDDGIVAGPPLVSPSLRVAPDVTGLTLLDGRERVTGSWRRPPGAVDVTVTPTAAVNDAGDGFTATDLAPGRHRFLVTARYTAPDGTYVAAPGVEASCTVHPWPAAVTTLTARPEPAGVRFAWSGGAGAEVRLVEWPGAAPVPGAEFATADVPPSLDWPADEDGLRVPPPDTWTTVHAVAVLGERAVAGPGVAVERPGAVRDLRVERTDGGLAVVRLRWPGDAAQIVLTHRQGAAPAESVPVTAHSFRRHGLRLPVGPGPAEFTAAPVPRHPEAVVWLPGEARTVLPPDASIAYRVLPANRRRWRRGAATLQVTLSSAQPPTEVPEFVCVARGGTLRPRDIRDGSTVLRIAGEELLRHGTVERPLPADPCPAPYTLRGFLRGTYATAVRLDEPAPKTLVVR